MQSKLLHSSFETSARLYPTLTALEFDLKIINYKDLNERANQLAHFLIAQGAKPSSDFIIGIFFKSGIEQIISVIAVLKAGCAYLPLDPEHPADRLSFMIQDAGITIVLTDDELLQTKYSHLKITIISFYGKIFQTYSKKNPTVYITNTNLAYVIYTSGSTGLPKGVMIEHRNAYNTLSQMGDIFSLQSYDKFLLNTSLGFDPSVWMIFWPLSVGGSVILSNKEKDPAKICAAIIANKFRIFHAGPTLFRMLLSQDKFSECKSLELIIGGGESWRLSDLRNMKNRLPQIELCNVYGPTEASIHITYWLSKKVNINSLSIIPIGKPIKNMQAFILDNKMKEVGFDQTSDLYIAGEGIGRGYLNNPKLTKEKFTHVIINTKNIRLYKTGDLAKKLNDGNFVFMGRTDDQIKLRGYRIEPIEIEHHILKSALVNDVCVMGTLKEQAYDRLVAFIVVKDAKENIGEKLKSILRINLPEYMVPSIFIILDELPFTINQKVDKAKLAHLIQKYDLYKNSSKANSDISDSDLIQLWRETLRDPMFKEHQNFFDAGGDSLSVLELIGKINEKFSLDLNVTVLFENPTIVSFKKFLAINKIEKLSANQFSQASIKKLSSPLCDNQLWLLRMAKGSLSINNIVMSFEIKNEINISALEHAVYSLINDQPLLRANIHFDNFNSHAILINKNIKNVFYYHDLSYLPPEERNNVLETKYVVLNNANVNFETDPLFKILVFKCTSNSFYIYLYVHHLISDPTSGSLLINKLLAFYKSACIGSYQTPVNNDILFFEYVEHEKKQKEKKEYQNQLKNWENILQGKNYLINFKEKHRNDLGAGYAECSISACIIEKIRSYVKDHGITLFVFYLSALKMCLYRLYEQDLFAVGINISKRNNARWSKMIGPLSEQFLSIIDFRKIINFEDLIKCTISNVNSILHTFVTIENIYRQIISGPEETKDLFNVLFDYEKTNQFYQSDDINIIPLTIKPTSEVRRHLSVRITDNNEEVILKVRYRKSIFSALEIDTIINKFIETLEKLTVMSELTI